MFVIEDEDHCEIIGTYTTAEHAQRELERLAALPWDHEPNRAPCMSWRTCGRQYVLIEYANHTTRRRIRTTPQFGISSAGTDPSAWRPASR